MILQCSIIQIDFRPEFRVTYFTTVVALNCNEVHGLKTNLKPVGKNPRQFVANLTKKKSGLSNCC